TSRVTKSGARPQPITPSAVTAQPRVSTSRAGNRLATTPVGIVVSPRPTAHPATAAAGPTAPTPNPSVYAGSTGVAEPWPSVTAAVPNPSRIDRRPPGTRSHLGFTGSPRSGRRTVGRRGQRDQVGRHQRGG